LPIPGSRQEGQPQPCDGDEVNAMLEGVTGVWFTGGDQYHIAREFLCGDGSDTRALAALRRIYNDGGVIGGSSAGAAMMSDVMIADGTTGSALNHPANFGYEGMTEANEGQLRIAKGLGFFLEGVVDQHFNTRPRFFRLIETLTQVKNKLGFAVSEDTAMVYDGRTGIISVLGEESVYIVNCTDALREGDFGALSYSGITLGMINEGDVYDTKNGRYRFYLSGEAYKQYWPVKDIVSGMVPSCQGFGDFIFYDVVHNKGDAASFIAGLYDGKHYGQELIYKKTQAPEAYRFNDKKFSFCGVRLDTKPFRLEKIEG
jgi:cyanophycinase